MGPADPAPFVRPGGSGPSPRARGVNGLRWRLLRDHPGGAAWNMAVDEALARQRGEAEAVLRIYRWRRPTLSFGRNQTARDRYDPHALRSLGVDVVRRPTGGREVLHDHELTYAVVAPADGPGSARALYEAVNGALIAALRALGVAADAADAVAALPPIPRPDDPTAVACFGAPAPGEVIAGGGKLVGSAQRRFGPTLLQHGSLLIDRPSVALDALGVGGRLTGEIAADDGFPPDTREGARRPVTGGVTLADLLPEVPGFARIAATVEAAFAGAFGGSWSRVKDLRPNEVDEARGFETGYRDDGWSWRS